MQWTPLPKGAFTGIDWSNSAETKGRDPYLVWAEADQFAGFGGQPPDWLPLALELEKGCSIDAFASAGKPQWLDVPPAYFDKAFKGLRFCTARVRPEFFRVLQAGGFTGMVKRFELGLPVTDPTEGTTDRQGAASLEGGPSPAAAPAAANRLTGKVLGLIDDSVALVHASFVRAGQPRTAWFWRQDKRGRGRVPAGFSYGHELAAADIRAAMKASTTAGVVDEAAVYVELGLSTLGQKWPGGKTQFHALDTLVSHGTHVLDLAAGPLTAVAQCANLPPGYDAPPSWLPANDDASRAAIVAVQLDKDTVADTSGGSMSVHVLDGLVYILSRCDAAAQVVVNISFGTLAGPHDGTALLEAAMDNLTGLFNGRLQIVLAAGNSYQARTHANVLLQPQQSQSLHWRVQHDDRTESFLELWIQQGSSGVEIEVTPPGHGPLPPLPWGRSAMWVDASGHPMCALVYPESVATGNNGTCALLALAPTFAFKASTTTAPAGVWRVNLANKGTAPAIVDGYIERDDVIRGTRRGGRQSHFEDAPGLAPEEQYDLQAYVDDPKRATPIRRSGNFNSIGTSPGTVSVGGVLASDPEAWARYSPRKPDPDEAQPRRPGVVRVPDRMAFSDETRALPGIRAAGTRSGATVRLAGTSDAAPQVARELLNKM